MRGASRAAQLQRGVRAVVHAGEEGSILEAEAGAHSGGNPFVSSRRGCCQGWVWRLCSVKVVGARDGRIGALILRRVAIFGKRSAQPNRE